MANNSKKTKGILGTILFHLVLLGILYAFGYTTPLPLPSEEGILVNFGNDENGTGLIEPDKNQYNPPANQVKTSDEVPETANDAYLTQNNEEAPSIESGDKAKEKEAEEARQKEIEKQRELERQREIERIKQEEIEKQRKENEQKEAINNLITDAFSKGKNNSESNNEGVNEGEGNQGVEDGDAQSNNHSNLPSIGGLDGRNPLLLPKPIVDYKVGGKVVVEVTVDRQGKVAKAVPGVKGSTTLNENLLKAAKEAALKSLFNVKTDAPAFQKGTITYYFKLQ